MTKKEHDEAMAHLIMLILTDKHYAEVMYDDRFKVIYFSKEEHDDNQMCQKSKYYLYIKRDKKIRRHGGW